MKKGPYFQPVQYISPLPEGYLQAASSIGQSYGRAIESIGDNISGAIKKYQKDKEESEILTGQAESITPLLQSFQGDIRDQKTQVAFDNLTKKLGDFAGQSLSQKRATLASAETFAKSFASVRQNETARIQRDVSAAQLENLNQQRRDQDAYTQSLGGPTTRDVPREVSMSGLIDQSQYLYNAGQNQPPATQSNFSNIDTEALRKMMNRGDGSQVPDSLPPPSPITAAPIGRNERVANFVRGMINRAGEYGNRAQGNRAQGNGITAAPMTAAERAAAMSTSPIPADSIAAAPMTAAERAAAMPIMAASMNARERAAALPTSFNQGIELPAQTLKRTVIDKVDLTPKEIYTNQLTSYIAKGGRVTPELNAQFKKDAGVNAPVDIKTLQIKDSEGNVLGTGILENGKIQQFIKPEAGRGPESSIGKLIFDLQEAALKGNKFAFDAIGSVIQKETANSGVSLTENQGNSLNYALRMILNEDELEKTQYQPQAFGSDLWVPERFKTSDRKLYETAKSNWISANLRKESGAAIGPNEFETANTQYFPQSGDNKDVIEAKARLRKQAYLGMIAAIGPQGPDLINKYSIRDKPNVNKTTTGKDTAGRTIIVER